MAVGIAAVVALTALGEGAREYVVQEFMSLGSNLLIVLPGKVETSGGMPWGSTTHDLTIGDFREVTRRIPGVRRAAPLVTGTETVRFGNRGRSVVIMGSTADMLEVRRLEVAAGKFLRRVIPTPVGPRSSSGSRWCGSCSAVRTRWARS